tara:strand:- start:564 stop:1370 length:807 start_codon:yes stop_codon:yes gene_type:complete
MVIRCRDCRNDIKDEYQNCKLITIGSSSYIHKICGKDLIKKKFFNKNNDLTIKETLYELDKPYLLKIDYQDDNIIIYQHIDGSTLYQYFNINISIDEYDKFIIFTKIFKILLDLEKSGFNHLDISSNNIMICNRGRVFLIDYEDMTNDTNYYSEYLGSYGFVPPEKMEDDKLVFNKFDSYSFGILLADSISKGYKIKIMDFKKKCVCLNKCDDLQSCIDRKINLILQYIKCINIKNFYKIILTNTIVLDHTKRKSFTELEPLVKDFIE